MRYLAIGISFLLLASCAPRVFQTSGLDTIVADHTTIAVVKPRVVYKNERQGKRKWGRVPSHEAIADGIQSGLVSWMEEQRERGKISITVTDTATTNQSMRHAEFTGYPELARTLGVDAVLVSRIDYDTRIDHSPAMMIWSVADDGTRSRIHLNLYSSSGKLIWSYEQFGAGSSQKRTYDQMVTDLLRDANRTIPYAAK